MPDTLRESATLTSPLTIPWSLAWWASDPDWANPGDGNVVSLWRNGGSTGAANNAISTTGGTKPTYRASVPAFNNRPALQFSSASNTLLYYTNGTNPPSSTGQVYAHPMWGPPFTLVAISLPISLSGSIIEEVNPAGGDCRLDIASTFRNAGIDWLPLSTYTPRTPLFHAVVQTDNNNAKMEYQGYALTNASAYGSAALGFGGSTGVGGFGGGTIGARYTQASSFLNGYLAFVGVYNGDLTTTGFWPSFKQWAKAYYNIQAMVP